MVGNVSLGLRLPPSRPYGSGCLSPEGDGLQPALSVLSFILWVVLAESYVRAFCVVGFPPSGLLAQVSSLWIYCWACNLLVLFIYLFFLPVMLPSVLPRLATDSAVRVFPCVWKPLFLWFPSWDGTSFLGQNSLPTSFVTIFIFYIFSHLFLKTMICFSGCLISSASIQKLFCGIYSALKCSFDESVREKVVSLSCHLRTALWFPLEWTGWISLQPKGLSRVFSNTTVQKHQFRGSPKMVEE